MVEFSSSTCPLTSPCWCFDGNKLQGDGWSAGTKGLSVHTDGYLYVALGGGKLRESGHRILCWVFHGPPPLDSHVVHHVCEHTSCLNPVHLMWKENSLHSREHALERHRLQNSMAHEGRSNLVHARAIKAAKAAEAASLAGASTSDVYTTATAAAAMADDKQCLRRSARHKHNT